MSLQDSDVLNVALLMGLGLLFAASLLATFGWLAANKPINYVRPAATAEYSTLDLNAPHPQGKVFALVCYLVAACLVCLSLFPVVNAACNYDRISLQPSSIDLHYALWNAPRSVALSDLDFIQVQQEYVVRNRSHAYWCTLVLNLKSGERIQPAFKLSGPTEQLPVNNEYLDLESLVNEMKKQGLPVRFTYIDRHGKIHQTQSLQERPGDES